MYKQQEPGWTGQLNENHERTDDLDGAAEGENETRRVISVQNQTVPSRPRSRDSHYHDRDEQDYSNTSSRVRSHAGRDETRRRRNDSFANSDRDRERMMNPNRGGVDEYGYEYSRRPRPSQHDRTMYPDPYYQMGAYNQSRSGYPMQMPAAHGMSSRDYLARLRVEYPVIYREWYSKFQMHKNNPHQVPFPPIPQFPNPMLGPFVGGPMSNVGGYQSHPYNLPQMGQQNHTQSFNGDTSTYDRHNIHSGNNSDIGNGRPSGRSSVVELGGYNTLHHGYPVNRTPSLLSYPVDESTMSITDYGPSGHETPPPRRMTPHKFNISHCIGNLTPLGKLLRIKGGGSAIEIIDIKPLMKHLPEYKEVEVFPGPLIKGITHKNNVIQFCQRKIREAQLNEAQVDKENFVLLWEYLILLLRQNGNVVGTDIAELLLKNTSSGESTEAVGGEEANSEQKKDDALEESEEKSVVPNVMLPVNEEKITEKFCELLLYGHKKDALEYAMNNALWGHAILLASKMDERTYGHVMARFANCTPYNHPLQTLYQVMSGKQPSSVTSCCDDSFGDWRPHLAMILSNAGCQLDVEVKAVITLGDTIATKGHIYAAQFCHLMGEVEFSFNSKLGPLLGLNSSAENIIEATQMTEILEFARSLSQSNTTLGSSFIQYKLSYTKTLLDYGFVQEAYAYCEEMAKNLQYIKKASNDEDVELLKWSILQIAERLVKCENTDSAEEPLWIQQLRHVNRQSSGADSVSDNSSERRDSIPENDVGEREKHELYAPKKSVRFENDEKTDDDDFYKDTEVEINRSSSNLLTEGDMENDERASIPVIRKKYVGYKSAFKVKKDQDQVNYESNTQDVDLVSSEMAVPLSSDEIMEEIDRLTSFPSYRRRSSDSPVATFKGTYPIDEPISSTSQLSSTCRPSTLRLKKTFLIDKHCCNENEMCEDHDNFYNGSIHSSSSGSNVNSPNVNGSSSNLNSKFHNDNGSVTGAGPNNNIPRKPLTTQQEQLQQQHQFQPLPTQQEQQRQHFQPLTTQQEQQQQHHQFQSLPNQQEQQQQQHQFQPLPTQQEQQQQHNQFQSLPTQQEQQQPHQHFQPIPTQQEQQQPHQHFQPIPTQQEQQHQNFQPLPTQQQHHQFQSLPTQQDHQHRHFQPLTNQTEQQHHHFQPLPPHQQQHHQQPPIVENKPSSQKKPKDGSKPGKGSGAGDGKRSSGWISGFFTKLSMKPNNQMYLPDDKDPSIVWNPDLNKWVNTKDDEDDTSSPVGPPPSDMALGGMPQSMMQPQAPQMMRPPSSSFQQVNQANNNNMSRPGPGVGMSSAVAPPNVPSYAPSNPQLIENNYQPQSLNYVDSGYQNYTQAPANDTLDSSITTAPGMINNNNNQSMNGPPDLVTGNNKYQLPKRRSARSGYVDILNPNNNNNIAAPSINRLSNMSNGGVGGNMMSGSAGAPVIPNMFIPSPVMGSGDSGPISFLTPSPIGPIPPNGQPETNS